MFEYENTQDMTAIEIKKLLIHRIEEINDVSFLNTIKTILDSKTESKTLMLTAEQQQEIQKSRKQIEQGQFVDQVELDKELSKWISEK